MEFLLVAFAWCIGGIVGGATGIGAIMLAMPLLTLVLSPSDAVLLSVVVGLFGTAQLAWAYRRHIVFRDIRDLVMGAVPGCVLGGWVLRYASVRSLQLMICAMLVCFILMRLFRNASGWRLPDSAPLGIAAGVVCGFVSSSVAMVGAPLGIYVLLKHWDPDRARGNMSGFYVAASLGAVASQAAAGLYTMALVPDIAAGILGCFIGTIFGVRIGRHVNQHLFQNILLLFLAAAAAILFARAL